MSDMYTETVDITPAMASNLLLGNDKNRNPSAPTVAKYAQLMREGKWMLCHQGIAISIDGKIVDGGHRLEAVVKAQTTVRMTITRNAPLDSQPVLDDGRKRSWADTLKLLDGPQLPTHVKYAVTKMIVGAKPATGKVSNLVKMEFSDSHAEGIAYISTAFKRRVDRLTIAPVLAACFRAYYHIPKEVLDRFVSVLYNGEWNSNEAPERNILLLRDLLLKAPSSMAGADWGSEVYLKTERALQAFRNRETIGKLYAAPRELYPLPEELRA